MGRLKGKAAFITGGANGIGRATAIRFAGEGARVLIADIDVAAGEEVAELANVAGDGEGGGALFVHTNVSEHDSVRAAVATAVERFGAFHILHNNAGGSTLRDGPVTEAPDEEFWRVMSLDVYGTFLCSKYAIPEIARAGGGSVINMSSNQALMGVPGRDCYTAAKGAIAALTRSMAVEYAADRIRVNAIAPSVTRTQRVMNLLANDANIEKQTERHLLGLAEPEHIANLAVYLAADESAVTTGQVIRVDSGITIS